MLKILPFLFAVFLTHLSIITNASASLTFNIISHSLENGAGKEVDVSILKENLEKYGHHVNLFDYYLVDSITPADINLFLAQFKLKWFSKAKLNWFIPNAEFCSASLADLKKFDLTLCKTEESFRIFTPLCKETFFLGFTSINRYQPSISKNFSHHLHVAGKSHMKGTIEIFNIWKKYRDLPYLILIKHKDDIYAADHTPKKNPFNFSSISKPKNLKFINKRIAKRSLLSMQNGCGIHLCPSKTEGFGHYLMEAMSTGAVVITTDAPPMNEFIHDQRCLVKYRSSGKKKYATTYSIDEKELAKTVKALQRLSHHELKAIGDHNREEFLRRDEEFKQNFEKLMKKAALNLKDAFEH